MTQDEIQTAILQVCKVSGNDSDFNVLGFYTLCDRLVELGAAAEREACAKEISAEINDEIEDEAYCILVELLARIRARGQG